MPLRRIPRPFSREGRRNLGPAEDRTAAGSDVQSPTTREVERADERPIQSPNDERDGGGRIGPGDVGGRAGDGARFSVAPRQLRVCGLPAPGNPGTYIRHLDPSGIAWRHIRRDHRFGRPARGVGLRRPCQRLCSGLAGLSRRPARGARRRAAGEGNAGRLCTERRPFDPGRRRGGAAALAPRAA